MAAKKKKKSSGRKSSGGPKIHPDLAARLKQDGSRYKGSRNHKLGILSHSVQVF